MRSAMTTKASRTRSPFAALVGSATLLATAACGNHPHGDQKTPPPTCINSCVPDLGSRPMTQKDCDDAEAGIEFLPLPIWDMGPINDALTDSSENAVKRNAAQYMYWYDDKTAIIRVPGKIWEPATEVAYSGVPPRPANGEVTAGWIPPGKYEETTKYWPNRPPLRTAVGRCGESLPYPNDPDATNDPARVTDPSGLHYALHVAGGPFQEWGGGMGRMLKCMNTDAPKSGTGQSHPWLEKLNLNQYLCSYRNSATYKLKNQQSLAACVNSNPTTPEAKTMRSVCPKRDLYYQEHGVPDETDEPYMTGMSLDLSQWEGIAFWARRSPNSQSGIRIAMADKYLDDDMSYLAMRYGQQHPDYAQAHPRYCERKTVCGCQNNKPCTKVRVVDNVFDADGNRIKWAADSSGNVRLRLGVDGDKIDDVVNYDLTHTPGLVEELSKRHSLINMSGDPIVNPNTGSQTFDDGATNTKYNGPAPGNGQPYDTDLLISRDETFCFDPAVDPVPPDGTPVSQIFNRGYQNNRISANNPTHYIPGGPSGFFYNVAPGALDQTDQPDWNGIQLPVADFSTVNKKKIATHTEQLGYNYTPCGESYCNFEYPSFQAVDPQTLGRQCTPYSYKGGITYSHCYNPETDPKPPENPQQCGDYWLKPVALGTDWQFYKVPFTSLIQQGWAKRFYQLDLTSITDVRIQWDRGWLDVWISDVRFYRTKN
jgi:hypothetical protein